MKNVFLSYANNPYSEYVGSHIYELLGLPTHKTLLGTRQGKTVVACKDFRGEGDELAEFRTIKTTFEPANGKEYGSNLTDGRGMEIDDILFIIQNHHMTKDSPQVLERFWQMFIIDAFIGNSDRNNGNWGLLVHPDNSITLAPIYDNGSCLNNKSNAEQMQNMMNDTQLLENRAFRAVTCYYEHNKRKINPFQFLERTDDAHCIFAVERTVPLILNKLPAIHEMIQSYDVIPQVNRDFYCAILETRAIKCLKKIQSTVLQREKEQKHNRGGYR